MKKIISLYAICSGTIGYAIGKQYVKNIEDSDKILKSRLNNFKIKYDLNNEQTQYLNNIYKNQYDEYYIKDILKYGSIFYYVWCGPILLFLYLSRRGEEPKK